MDRFRVPWFRLKVVKNAPKPVDDVIKSLGPLLGSLIKEFLGFFFDFDVIEVEVVPLITRMSNYRIFERNRPSLECSDWR